MVNIYMTAITPVSAEVKNFGIPTGAALSAAERRDLGSSFIWCDNCFPCMKN